MARSGCHADRLETESEVKHPPSIFCDLLLHPTQDSLRRSRLPLGHSIKVVQYGCVVTFVRTGAVLR